MSASAITDRLIDNLSAASVIGACQVATHFAVLEATNACAGVVVFTGMESDPWAMGNQHQRFYTHQVQLFVKDRSGNSELIERDFQKMFDASVCSIETDRNLGNEDIYEITSLNGSHDPNTLLNTAGHTWSWGTLDIRTREWPTNT